MSTSPRGEPMSVPDRRHVTCWEDVSGWRVTDAMVAPVKPPVLTLPPPFQAMPQLSCEVSPEPLYLLPLVLHSTLTSWLLSLELDREGQESDEHLGLNEAHSYCRKPRPAMTQHPESSRVREGLPKEKQPRERLLVLRHREALTWLDMSFYKSYFALDSACLILSTEQVQVTTGYHWLMHQLVRWQHNPKIWLIFLFYVFFLSCPIGDKCLKCWV